jgi:simple sugar transport system ATP-binding protein
MSRAGWAALPQATLAPFLTARDAPRVPFAALVERGLVSAWQRLVACVYQKSMVVPSLTVAENIFLNRATGDDHGIVNWRAVRSRARQVMLDWASDLTSIASHGTSVEQRQVVEPARFHGALPDPRRNPQRRWRRPPSNAYLKGSADSKEVEVGILHLPSPEEIYEVCDRVTVLRDGLLC